MYNVISPKRLFIRPGSGTNNVPTRWFKNNIMLREIIEWLEVAIDKPPHKSELMRVRVIIYSCWICNS